MPYILLHPSHPLSTASSLRRRTFKRIRRRVGPFVSPDLSVRRIGSSRRYLEMVGDHGECSFPSIRVLHVAERRTVEQTADFDAPSFSSSPLLPSFPPSQIPFKDSRAQLGVHLRYPIQPSIQLSYSLPRPLPQHLFLRRRRKEHARNREPINVRLPISLSIQPLTQTTL